jgi:hypothetical protein
VELVEAQTLGDACWMHGNFFVQKDVQMGALI